MVEPSDVHAALEARRELGPAYEDQIADSLLAKIEQKIDLRRTQLPAARRRRGSITPLALGSIGLGVWATSIATTNGASWLAGVAWAAIAAINVAVAYLWRH
jgi:hypothetical protein